MSSSKDTYWEASPSALPSLPSLDCWDYSIELECLQGPEGNLATLSRRVVRGCLLNAHIGVPVST